MLQNKEEYGNATYTECQKEIINDLIGVQKDCRICPWPAKVKKYMTKYKTVLSLGTVEVLGSMQDFPQHY